MENYHTHIPYHLILGEIEQNLSGTEAEELEEWIKASAENLNIYNDLRSVDGQLDLLRFYQQTDSLAAWEKARAKMVAPVSKTQMYLWSGAIAAAVILAISVIIFRQRTVIVYETAYNETKQIVLPDSSTIQLNQNSAISFNKNKYHKNRYIKLLKGEAFFSVVHNEAKEFNVETGNIIIRDIGTSFDIKMDSGFIQTIVSTGSVSMEYHPTGILKIHNTPKVILAANEMGVFNRKTKRITATTNLPAGLKSWQDKKLRYVETPLYIVLEDLRRIYGTRVILADSTFKTKTLTALLNNKSQEQILQIVATSLQLKLAVVKKDSIFILSR
ncbi:FecR family protein [Chitinophaga sancti]|uniref:FecR family protein n=1 Tax=Chitinophaga sancti TaxID=1004 RepID=UPI003F796196